MLYNLIDHDLVDVIDNGQHSWQEAVTKTTSYLENKGYVTSDYANAIIQSTVENGPYYVLCPNVAMPHARPEAGVLKTGLGIHVFSHPVDFGSDMGPASILFTLAATDSDTHINVIQGLCELLEEEENISKLSKAVSKQQILDLIQNIQEGVGCE